LANGKSEMKQKVYLTGLLISLFLTVNRILDLAFFYFILTDMSSKSTKLQLPFDMFTLAANSTA